jgi:hypothetical protein
MIKRELSKMEFLDIAVGLELGRTHFKEHGLHVAAGRCENLRKLFEAAHTAWLEIEEGRHPNERKS